MAVAAAAFDRRALSSDHHGTRDASFMIYAQFSRREESGEEFFGEERAAESLHCLSRGISIRHAK